MKTKLTRKVRKVASTLLATLFICSLLSACVMYYLALIDQQSLLSSRSQTWNMAITVSEAGVEEAMQHLNNNAPNLNVDGWAYDSSISAYWRSNSLPDGNSYAAYIFYTNSTTPVIIARGNVVSTVTYAQAASASGLFAAANQTYMPATVTRTVQVTCNKSSLFQAALVVKQNIDLKGNGVYTDSYDSTDPTKSTDMQYDSSKYSGNYGDVATDGGITDSVSVQNANIYGTIHTGPNCPVSFGPNGGVGPHGSQVNTVAAGVAAGYIKQDANFTFPDTTLPNTSGWLTPLGGQATTTSNYVTTGGVRISTLVTSTYDYILLAGQKYLIPTTSGKKFCILGSGVTVVLPNGLDGSEYFTFQTNADMLAYCDKSVSLTGNNVVNPNGTASSLTVYCTPNVTSFTLAGNGAFTGCLVCPSADVALKGGGNNNQDFCGSLMANSITMNGHFSFHWDESLKNYAKNGRYLISAWNEIK